MPEAGITFNQFLIDDERPALIHTGMHEMYEAVRGAVAEVLDPARLDFVALLHFEADECGGMGRFLLAAGQGRPGPRRGDVRVLPRGRDPTSSPCER